MKSPFLFLAILLNTVSARTQNPDPELLRVPVLSGESRSSVMPANAGSLCFDKLIQASTEDDGGRVLYSDIYVNSRLGYIGIHEYTDGGTAGPGLNPNQEGFRFQLITLEGNNFVYFTKRTSGQLKQYVITHNSDFYNVPADGFSMASTLRKQNEENTYGHRRAGILNCTAYQAAGRQVKYFIYGVNSPTELRVTSGTRYLGVQGVGYFNIGSRVYLSMARWENGIEKTRINYVRVEENCFNSAVFQVAEDVAYNRELESIQRQREKLLRERPSSGACVMEDLAIRNFRFGMLDRAERLLEKTVVGNTLVNAETNKAFAGLLDYEDQLRLMILEQEKRICNAQDNISRFGSRPDKEQKLSCYRRQLAEMNRNLTEMRSLNSRYPDDPPKKMQEQIRLVMIRENCN